MSKLITKPYYLDHWGSRKPKIKIPHTVIFGIFSLGAPVGDLNPEPSDHERETGGYNSLNANFIFQLNREFLDNSLY